MHESYACDHILSDSSIYTLFFFGFGVLFLLVRIKVVLHRLTCYNSSQYVCYNNTVCSTLYSCGGQCLTTSSACASNNHTICYGFPFWSYYYRNNILQLCGPQQQCYDNTTSVCLNRTTVCQGLNAQLCGTSCFDPTKQICTNGIIQCINSCNGACYSNSQYCNNNTIICNKGELVCDVQNYNNFEWHPLGLTCYNSSQYVCYNNTVCSTLYSCGGRCLTNYNSSCASDNHTVCYGFPFWSYYYRNNILQLCGPQQQCYDNTTSLCMGTNNTACSIGSQLCSGVCYNPQTQYCTSGNNAIFCLNNPSSVNCLRNTTISTSSTSRSISTVTTKSTTTPAATTTTTTPSSCFPVKNCTKNSDCCQSNLLECQCFRHTQTDVYGSCVNPTMTPICGDSCPVQGKCKTDGDCCKYQCATITFTGPDGTSTTMNQCAQR